MRVDRVRISAYGDRAGGRACGAGLTVVWDPPPPPGLFFYLIRCTVTFSDVHHEYTLSYPRFVF